MAKVWMPPGVRWLLACEPRPVQLEALARSYTGVAYRDSRDMAPRGGTRLSHAGQAAWGWGHLLEMRLGKTPLILNEYLMARQDLGLRNLIVLTPSKYKHAWPLEAERFGVEVPAFVFQSAGPKAIREYERIEAKHPEGFIISVNYEALVQDYNYEWLLGLAARGTMIAADESVMIKNKASTAGKRSVGLAERTMMSRIATGMATPQGPHDLYNQLNFIGKMDQWGYLQFRNTFCLRGGFRGKQILPDVKNEERLHELAKGWYFSARRAEWGTNLEPDYETIPLTMTPEQKLAYRTMEREFAVWLGSGQVVTVEQAITKHMKLQQISSGFIYDELGKPHPIIEFQATPKFQELRDRLENYFTSKIIVLAHYRETVDKLYEHLQEYNPALIRGTEDMKRLRLDTEQQKQKFNHDPTCRVMIGQMKSIKYGHNLMGNTADPCLTTVYYENTYSADDRMQTEQRNQGEGQQRGIHIMDFVSSPIEKRIITRLQAKENVAGIIMGYYRREYADVSD